MLNVFWTNLVIINYYVMNCSLPITCAWNARKKSQTHLPELIWLMMIMGFFWTIFVCYQYQKGILWCYGICPLKIKIWKKKISQILCLMLDLILKKPLFNLILLVMTKVWTLLKHDKYNHYILCFWNVIISYIQWQNLKLDV